MRPVRSLVVVADDFGIGPETSRGILDLAAEGRLTATVLLVTSPFAEPGLAAWERAGRPIELGWHPCLTLDTPVLPPEEVPSLVRPDGTFWSLGQFLRRVLFGRIRAAHVAAELRAQFDRFRDLVGHPPTVVNAHHHVAVFSPVRQSLAKLLAELDPRPFVRRVVEPLATIARVPCARLKRAMLASFGRRGPHGFPGCDVLTGITDPPQVADEAFFTRWLIAARGETVELMCHPGHHDETLIGRDDAMTASRVHELHLLRSADFLSDVRRAGFRLTAPAELTTARRFVAA
jgi:chitin disaccharide deacetylase